MRSGRDNGGIRRQPAEHHINVEGQFVFPAHLLYAGQKLIRWHGSGNRRMWVLMIGREKKIAGCS